MIIIEPIITEKSVGLSEKGKYVFKVEKKATKSEIKKKVAEIFNVKVKNINIIHQKGKRRVRGRVSRITGRTPGFKKAIVTLEKGEKIKELEIKE